MSRYNAASGSIKAGAPALDVRCTRYVCRHPAPLTRTRAPASNKYKGRSPVESPGPHSLLLSSRGAGITLGTLGRQLLLKPVPQRLQVLQNPRQGEPYRPLLDVLKRL